MPRVWPVVGNLPALDFDMLHIPTKVRDLYDDLGTDTMRLALFSKASTVRTRSYEDVLLILKTWPKMLQSRSSFGLGIFSLFLGEGLASIDSGETHQKLNDVMGPCFRKVTTDQMLLDFKRVALNMIQSLSTRGEHDMQSIAMAATVDSIGQLHFGTDLKQLELLTQEPSSSSSVAQIMTRITQEGQMLMLPSLVDQGLPKLLPGFQKYLEAIGELDDLIENVIEQRRAKGLKETDLDVLSSLLRASEEEGNEWLTKSLLRDQMTTLFFAGSDTTASTIAWSTFELAKNPEIQMRLQEEADELMDKLDGDVEKISARDLDQMKLLNGAIKETLRLYPPAPVIGRDCPEDALVDGFQIEKGQVVITDVYAVNRDAKLWQDPDVWEPRRWTEEAEGDWKATKQLISFAPGLRSCLGKYFAIRESSLFLLLLLYYFEFEPGSEEPQLAHAVTITSLNGIKLKLRKRR